MSEKSETFCVKAEGRSYCNCRLSIELCNCKDNLKSLAEEMYSSAIDYCERIYTETFENHKELRERYNVTPYGFCFSICAAPVSERIYAVNVEHVFYARFPGGERRDVKRTFLFDEMLNIPITDSSFGFLSFLGENKSKRRDIKYIGAENGELIFCRDDERIKLSFVSFEAEYARIMRNKKKASKGIDNFKKV